MFVIRLRVTAAEHGLSELRPDDPPVAVGVAVRAQLLPPGRVGAQDRLGHLAPGDAQLLADPSPYRGQVIGCDDTVPVGVQDRESRVDVARTQAGVTHASISLTTRVGARTGAMPPLSPPSR